MSTEGFIDQKTAEEVLMRFGIFKSTSAYDRWLTNDGFYLKDFDDVLFESPHIITFDWRESPDQIGLQLSRIFNLCGLQIVWELLSTNHGTLSSGEKKIDINYDLRLDDNLLPTVAKIVQMLGSDKIVSFSALSNVGSDTMTFAILKKKDADKLRREHLKVLAYFFEAMDAEFIQRLETKSSTRAFSKILTNLFRK